MASLSQPDVWNQRPFNVLQWLLHPFRAYAQVLQNRRDEEAIAAAIGICLYCGATALNGDYLCLDDRRSQMAAP